MPDGHDISNRISELADISPAPVLLVSASLWQAIAALPALRATRDQAVVAEHPRAAELAAAIAELERLIDEVLGLPGTHV